jgi:hypothetical protein
MAARLSGSSGGRVRVAPSLGRDSASVEKREVSDPLSDHFGPREHQGARETRGKRQASQSDLRAIQELLDEALLGIGHPHPRQLVEEAIARLDGLVGAVTLGPPDKEEP